LHAEPVLPRNVRLNHCRNFLVSEQFLNSADVLTFLEQMRGKRMAERVRAGVFFDFRFVQSLFICPIFSKRL
jgi:hypothetical protein